MVLVAPQVCDRIWLDKPKYDAAERRYYENLSQSQASGKVMVNSTCLNNPEGRTVETKPISDTDLVPAIVQSDVHTIPKISELKLKEGGKEETTCKIIETSASQEPVKLISAVQIEQNTPASLKCSNYHEYCSRPNKSDKVKKPESLGQKVEPLTKLNDKNTSDQSTLTIQNNLNTATDNVGQICEVSKGVTQNANSWNSLAGEVAKARQHIKNSLQCIDDIAVTTNTVSIEVANRVVSLEKENQDLASRMEKMEQRIASLEKQLQLVTAAAASTINVCPVPAKKGMAPKPPAPAKPSNDDEDDGVDLFASDSEEEDTEAAKLKEQRLAEYAAKKSKKPALIAKSSIILDVKPWDDETDMKLLEQEVRKIETEGLLWGASKLVPLAYGIHKLQISCVVEDEKVSVDWLQETIQEIEDYVQSVDIAAFNKI